MTMTTAAGLTTLQLVNSMLATLGETPVSSLDIEHPLVAMSLQIIDNMDFDMQSQNWWFNTSKATLRADPVTKIVIVPASTLDFYVEGNKYTVRGNKLYDRQERTYEIGRNVEGILKERLPFEELPPVTQVYLKNLCLQEFTKNNQGHDKADLYNTAVRMAYAQMHRQHLRHINQNILDGVVLDNAKWRG